MDWARMLTYITGTVDQELLLRNEYLVAENRILKAQLKTPLRLTDAERTTLAEIAHRLGRKALEEVANVMKLPRHSKPALPAHEAGCQAILTIQDEFFDLTPSGGGEQPEVDEREHGKSVVAET